MVDASFDFKLRACLDYAHGSWSLHRTPKSPALKPITDFFRGRCARLRALMQLPAQTGNVTIKMQKAFYVALFEITGKVNADDLTEEQIKRTQIRWNELLSQYGEEASRLRGTPEWDNHVHKELIEGLVPAEVMAAEISASGAIQASMMSYVTTGWTIVETMSGDLWEASLNDHPSSLANLRGASSNDSKLVRLDDIAMHNFDVAKKMGTILRSKFTFSSLEGVREAYACAFKKGANQIERALADKALDALSAMRNVIVHRDAIADRDYIKKTKFLRSLPPGEEGKHILLNGQIVVGLLKPAISAANQLLVAVDEWLLKNHD